MITQPIRVLTQNDMEEIHQAALTILEDVGMKIESEKALAYLKKIGCKVDANSYHVIFPKKIVQQYVNKMRNDYDDPKRIPEKMSVRYSHIRFRKQPHKIHTDFTASAGGFCCFILDMDGNRREATMDDVHKSINMVNNLDSVDYTGMPVSDQRTPHIFRAVKMAAELAKYSTKFGGVETFKKEDIAYLIEIGTIVKGSIENLKNEPILVGYAEARSPLCIDRNMAEIFIEYIERGFPQTLDTMPNGGATAPVTGAGLLALGIAETLGGVVLGYAIDENAIVGVDITPSYCDMQSGIYRYASPERMPLLVARVQMISEYYGCPSGVHGCRTDSCSINVQCGIEKATSLIFPVLAGAVGVGTIGNIENCVLFSPQQLVIDNEIIRSMRRMLKPLVVNDKTLGLDVIRSVGIGGNYLNETHTFEKFKDELFVSDLFERAPWGSIETQAIKGMQNKAYEKANEIWNKEPEVILDTEKIKAIEKVVSHAEQHLSK